MTKTARYLLVLFYTICSYVIISYIYNALYVYKHGTVKFIYKPHTKQEQEKILSMIKFLKQYTQDHTEITHTTSVEVETVIEYLNTKLLLRPRLKLVTYRNLINHLPKTWYAQPNKYIAKLRIHAHNTTEIELLVYEAITALHHQDLATYREKIALVSAFNLEPYAKQWIQQAESYIYYQELLNNMAMNIIRTEIII